MCGNNRCIYYGCDECCRWMPDEVLILTRGECSCTNDLYKEFCSQECLDKWEAEFECDCAHPQGLIIVRGPSQK